jgi:hypothetical protein
MPEPTYEERVTRDEKIKTLFSNCNCGRWELKYTRNDEPTCTDLNGILCPNSTLSGANIPGSDAYNCNFRGKVKTAFIDESYSRLIKFELAEAKK